MMTAEQRNELGWAKNAKIIRLGVYDIGILIGAVLLADRVGELWPQYEFGAFAGAVFMWVGMVFSRYTDWKAIAVLEKGLDRDELERETGQRLNKDELKNLGLD